MAVTAPLIVKGWATGKAGRHLVNLRIRVGGRVEPVVYGFPRVDLANFFGARERFLPAGFEAVVLCPPGPCVLEFEGCDIGGQWHPVGSLQLNVGEAAPAAAPAPVIQPHEFARALQFVLRRDPASPVRTAAMAIVDGLPVPQVIRYPHRPFHGHLHQPALLERTLFGRMRLAGWLFHESAVIRRVAASVDLHTWHELRKDEAVPHVAAAFPQFAPAAGCGFSGLIDLTAQLPRPVPLRLYAELEDGSWHLCHVQRVNPWTYEEEKAPFVRFGRWQFARTCLALHAACRARPFTVPPFRQLWSEVADAYRDYFLRATRRPRVPAAPSPALAPAPARAVPRVALITHNLNYEGAPLFLLEFARHLAASGTKLQVFSAAPGPLGAAFVKLGATVEIVDVTPLDQVAHARQLQEALRQLSSQLDLTGTALVVANTLSAYWGIHLARLAGRPSLFYIHESTTPANFYLGHMAPETLPVIEETFRIATHVSFLTEATRVYYRPYLGAANHSINPGWIDLLDLERHLAAHSRDELRRRLGLDPGTRLVINVGSVCERKGQHVFARGVDLLWRQAPDLAESCRFLMIGGRDTPFDRDMAQLLAQLNRPNLQIIPVTTAPADYYGAADLFVCSSYEESFPRVVLEAMACRVPILSTNVHGIPDMITHAKEGWLIPPGHSQAISEGMQHLLLHPELMREMATQARTRVVAEFGAELLLPRHAALAATLAATGGAGSRA